VPFRIIVFSGRKGEQAPHENPPNGDFFVFSHGDLSPRHTKVRDIPCVAFSATVSRIFAWRGERSPCKNPPNHHLAGFRVATFCVFAPKTRLYDMAQISNHNLIDFCVYNFTLMNAVTSNGRSQRSFM